MSKFQKIMLLIAILALIPLIYLSWGEANYLGYIVAFLIGHLIGGLPLDKLGANRQMPIETAKAHLVHLSEQQRNEIIEPLVTGRKIEAIKMLRLHSGMGLKEAKDVVEALQAAPGGPENQF